MARHRALQRGRAGAHRAMATVSALLLAVSAAAGAVEIRSSDRAERAAARVLPRLTTDLAPLQSKPGDAVFLRLFKLEAEMELWIRPAGQDARFVLFRTYPICAFSGTLGPKLRQGDGQAPEGFYTAAPRQLNPYSSYHLSFDLGYPNAYDRAHARTGSLLMVHGNCVSIGCYAMGDGNIEEIYTLVAAALRAGQAAAAVHAFPFRFDRADAAQRLADPTWGEFWQTLKSGFDAFERDRVPPRVTVQRRRYVVRAGPVPP